MLANGWLVLWAMASLCAAAMIVRRRRRRTRRPMVTLDLTAFNGGWKHFSAAGVMYDQAAVDRIANQSLAVGMVIGAMTLFAGAFIVAVWVCRGSGNRPRNGRGVS